MKLNIRNPFRRHEAAPEQPKPPSQLTPADVWAEPALHNRATRRWARLWGSIWKWDQQALGLPADLPSRYVRRHLKPAQFIHPKTRRQRKARARIMRAVAARGGARL